MGCTVDHLSADHLVRVIRRFDDARGNAHEAGESGVIRGIHLDFGAGEIVIVWERGGARESMHFRLDARDGPRNGRMKEYFEIGEYMPLPRPPKPPPSPPAALEPSPSAANVWALAARRQFEQARAELLEVLRQPYAGGSGEWARVIAEQISAYAEAHASDADPVVYEWLKEECLYLWYHWGSGATSGGEGTARQVDIDRAERRFRELDAARESGRQ